MSSLNKVILVGNVGKDPDIRHMTTGDRVASFSLATSESWMDKRTSEKKQRTEWHNVVVFNDRLVGLLEKYVRKGNKIYVEGQIQTRTYKNDKGYEVLITEVVLKKFAGEIILLGSPNSEGGQSTVQASVYEPKTFVDDEIPF